MKTLTLILALLAAPAAAGNMRCFTDAFGVTSCRDLGTGGTMRCVTDTFGVTSCVYR